jgi:hypothetical protein
VIGLRLGGTSRLVHVQRHGIDEMDLVALLVYT